MRVSAAQKGYLAKSKTGLAVLGKDFHRRESHGDPAKLAGQLDKHIARMLERSKFEYVVRISMFQCLCLKIEASPQSLPHLVLVRRNDSNVLVLVWVALVEVSKHIKCNERQGHCFTVAVLLVVASTPAVRSASQTS